MKLDIYNSLKELESKYLFYRLGPMVVYGDSNDKIAWSQAVWVHGKNVGILVHRSKSEIMSVLDAEEGEG